ncbi:hypothetical protein [Xylella fastidiosa]|uniref:hypothetical protein n=1 Tax=Xylella fastidiosa TaxID=2371 RepID=UPI0003F8B361|nr:hypothetical protein [Xylella fastidiosa]MBS9485311.1 hypothetical protein [Xylella fastidiosa subsp. multiplex]MDC6412520.1 hypothetical protein [Xylella fastidiosa subsp. multiplex]MDD0863199.1 hypothetical protein [Xylella fastidiosa subsp. multiplex]MDD0865290.1 hypothetical protein [Xylella fastidiosa subsp. multiplex]MDD0872146.1 hypothetical protein [Xylella fastidiosa subsp. multiplex]
MAAKRSDLADSETRFRMPEGRAVHAVHAVHGLHAGRDAAGAVRSNSAGQFKEGMQKGVL